MFAAAVTVAVIGLFDFLLLRLYVCLHLVSWAGGAAGRGDGFGRAGADSGPMPGANTHE